MDATHPSHASAGHHPVADTRQGQFLFAEPDDDLSAHRGPQSTDALGLGEPPPGPVNWNLLTAAEAAAEWLDLDAWVDWLRHTYGLPPTIVPPLWHRHDELVWELSALHIAWLAAYDPEGHPSGPLSWHREFTEARHRLREWVSTCGTRLERDRPTRHTAWPGDPTPPTYPENQITDRRADFLEFVHDDIATRRHIEDQVLDTA